MSRGGTSFAFSSSFGSFSFAGAAAAAAATGDFWSFASAGLDGPGPDLASAAVLVSATGAGGSLNKRQNESLVNSGETQTRSGGTYGGGASADMPRS